MARRAILILVAAAALCPASAYAQGGGEAPPGGIVIRHGELVRAYVNLDLPGTGIPLFPGVFLTRIGAGVALIFAALGTGAALEGVWSAATVLIAAALLIVVSTIQDCATAAGVLRIALAEEAEHAHREFAPRAEEPAARPEPRLARNGFSPAVEVEHSQNGVTANGHTEHSRLNGVAMPSSLNLTDGGLSVPEREE